jgi:hypothetical protein
MTNTQHICRTHGWVSSLTPCQDCLQQPTSRETIRLTYEHKITIQHSPATGYYYATLWEYDGFGFDPIREAKPTPNRENAIAQLA